jgi:hypothetical protein
MLTGGGMDEGEFVGVDAMKTKMKKRARRRERGSLA